MTAGAASRRPSSWSPPAGATAAAATSSSTCVSTTTPTRSPSCTASSASTRCSSARPTPPTACPWRATSPTRSPRASLAAGHGRDSLDASLASWAGVENLEERLHPGLIDPVVLDHLRRSPQSRRRRRERPRRRRRHDRRDRAVVGIDGAVLARGYQEFTQHFPQHRLGRARARGDLAGGARGDPRCPRVGVEAPTAVGVTNQRETAVLWDRETLGAARRAIVWQDRRTAGICERAAHGRPRA